MFVNMFINKFRIFFFSQIIDIYLIIYNIKLKLKF
jgi:hypothetical protein